jgi:hypothetical protein
MLVAHSCFCAGSELEAADYFQSRWDRTSTLVLGKSFHPGGYATPFGCAVGWEAAITAVCFKSTHFKYKVSHIRCNTARHKRGCATYPRREQGNSKKVGCSQNPINCSEPFLCPLAPFSGKMTFSLDVSDQSLDGPEANRPLPPDERDGSRCHQQ